MLGDFKTAAVLLLKNLDGNEFVFGSNSIEVANEILKVVDFLIADINFTMDKTLRLGFDGIFYECGHFFKGN